MLKYRYKFLPTQPKEVVEQDSFNPADSLLLEDFKVNNNFDQANDYIELHYYTLDGRILKSIPNYTNITSAQDSETAIDGALSTITLGTEDDIKTSGYEAGDVFLYYNFFTDPFTDGSGTAKFFIEEISPDRTEIRLLSTKITNENIQSYTDEFKEDINESDFESFYINLGNNRLLLATNIDHLPYDDNTSVVVKLYNSLPVDINTKTQLSISRVVSDSVAYEVSAELIEETKKKLYIKGPNFNIDEGKTTSSPTQYFNINEVFNYPVTNSYFEVKSLFEEKGAQLSIDHSDYDSFINFSSAQERLANFKYKLDLISTYQSESNNIQNVNTYSTGSSEYYDGLVNNILSNFDHYDRFLYYESSSYSWPKSGTAKPFTPLTGSATGSWYNTQITSASNFDASNPNQLINTIPEFLREDPNNTKYNTFTHMVAQHFDNLWIYAKSVTEKYDGDNRLGFGISKDLIEDALKNFGVKLYNSNRSSQELFSMFTGESYSTGSESFVNEIISGSDTIVSQEDYRKQIYKRLYHNLPYLLKTKGTERGLRALFSTFGIPSLYSSGSHSGLKVLQQGGTISGSYNLGGLEYTSASLAKIKLDNTGSIEGTTLSQYTSIVKNDTKYNKELSVVQVGYSPSDTLNDYIIESASLDSFNIDSILGDPGFAYSSSYVGLFAKAKEYLAPTTSSNYNLKDFTRILKFYDNILFKTVNDFLPARSNIGTGVVIKPHLLERPKVKQVQPSRERHNHFSSSIGVQSSTGSHGSTFGGHDQYTSSYTEFYMTSGGLAPGSFHSHEQAKYDGEFSGSKITLTNGELNYDNSFKYDEPIENELGVIFFSASVILPTPTPTPTPTKTPTTPTPTPTTTLTSTPTNTPTPTPSGNTAVVGTLRVRVEAAIGVSENAQEIEYRIDGNLSTSAFTKTLVTGDTAGAFVTAFTFSNVSVTDELEICVTRDTPDDTTVDGGSILVGTGPSDADITPGAYSISNGDAVVNYCFTVDNFAEKTNINIDVTIGEG